MPKTTFFAILATDPHGTDVVSFEVEGTTRSALDPVLLDMASHAGECWYLDLTVAGCPSWVLSTPDAEAHAERDTVPEPIREAGALWWAVWAGRYCAREWHEQGPWPIAEGTDYREWAQRQELPADGDVEFLEGGLEALVGRGPNEAEGRAFKAALLERLFNISPVEEAA